MDVVVTSRRCQLTDAFREHVSDKLASLEKLKDRIIRAEVMVICSDARQPDQQIRVEVTLIGKGPVVRAEGTADDKMAAFERALDRLRSQLRKASDRRKAHHGLRGVSVKDLEPAPESATDDSSDIRTVGGLEIQGDGPLVVREKNFTGTPLTLAQALDEMELVGHDFFLYLDAESSRPSVVYRRKAYDYGVIHLAVEASA